MPHQGMLSQDGVSPMRPCLRAFSSGIGIVGSGPGVSEEDMALLRAKVEGGGRQVVLGWSSEEGGWKKKPRTDSPGLNGV